jgi:hypothetical protein
LSKSDADPENKTIKYYTEDMFDWIKNNYTDPVNIWLFSNEGGK